jgi:DNA anti-recombination protein RmuC
MKIKNIAKLVFVGLLGLSTTSYAQTNQSETDFKDVKQETKEMIKTLSSYSSEKQDEAAKEVKKSLEKLDKRIDNLEKKVDNRWEGLSKEAKHETRENLRDLRKQRNKLSEWYGGMKNSSKDACNHLRDGFPKAYKNINKAWEKSEKEFENSK